MKIITKYYFDLTVNFITLLIFVMYCNTIFNKKRKLNAYLINMILYVIFILITSFVSFSGYVFASIAANWLFIYATYLTDLKTSIKHTFLFNLLFYALFTIIYAALTFITYIVLNIHNDLFENIKILVITTGIYIVFVLLFSHKMKNKVQFHNPYKKYIYLLILLICAVLCFLVIYSLRYTKYVDVMEFVLLGTLLLNIMMIVLILSVYEKIVDSLQEEALKQIQQQRYELTQSYNDNIAEKSKQLISIRHDFKNHLGVITGRLENENYKEALSYLKSITNTIQLAGDLVITNNTTISSILQSKKLECERKGITFNYTAAFEKIYILLDIELTIILGNILDNAIEALEPSELENKYLNLSITQIDTYLIIQCDNPYINIPQEKKGFLITSKAEKEYHGFGLKNVSEICEKYRGELHHNYNNSIFTIQVLIPNY